MEIIPVIDLKGGCVVRAFGGRRADYRPIVSRLSATSRPIDVVAGFVRLFAVRTVYVADLDSIDAQGDHRSEILALAEAYPRLHFWVDAGAMRSSEFARVDPVIGSESLNSLDMLRSLPMASRALLSLDFRGDALLGPPELLASPQLWPGRVIVMTLSRVGSNAGPDLERLASLVRHAPGRQFFAAGGVRGAADLDSLKAAGAAGVLVASALHDGALTAADLAKFAAQ